MRKEKTFKKIAILGVLFSLILFQLPIKAFGATPVFNNDPLDKETLRLKNRTTGDAEWKDPVSAEAGQRIAFNVYYHNTVSGTVAKNTKIRLDFEDNKNSKLTFRAFLWADNASYVQDLGIVNVPCSGLNFEFDRTAKWYPNAGTVAQDIPVNFVQTNSILVNIGDIAGGWSTAGQVVFEGKITEFPPRFNYMAEDKETLRLKNRTAGDAEWKDPVSADGGDTIAFNVYYHNGIVCSTAKNVRISIEFPQEEGNKISVVGRIESDNAPMVQDPGVINVSNMPEKLTFKTTALWYPNGSVNGQSVPVTISGNKAIVNIGDIKGCWEYAGQVVFEATLSYTPLPTPTPKPPVVVPTPTPTPPGAVLGAYTEKQLPQVPVTGASSIIALTGLSSIFGGGAVVRKRMKDRLLKVKLSKAIAKRKVK